MSGLWPCVDVVFAVGNGALTWWYPYPFVDVAGTGAQLSRRRADQKQPAVSSPDNPR